jgi:hypothetical protein
MKSIYSVLVLLLCISGCSTQQHAELPKEGLTSSQVKEVVSLHLPEIKSCNDKFLLKNAKLSGHVEYEWQISPSGIVNWVKVKKSDLTRDNDLNNCVIAVFKKIEFPIAKNGLQTQPTIGFPFGHQ